MEAYPGSDIIEELLWEPTDDMVSIKSWELDKAIDEWNDRDKAG